MLGRRGSNGKCWATYERKKNLQKHRQGIQPSFKSKHYDAEDKQYSQRWERPYSSTIGMNFGLSTAESCSFVLAASFAKDCE